MTYDLLPEPWIPVLSPTGQTEHVGLLDLFRRAHELKALLPETPDITIGLYRMLLAILHRAYDGPRNLKKDWRAIWDNGRFHQDRIEAYLTKWRSRFDLWDARHPFLQDPDASLDDAVSASRLFVERAQGNNATLFDHTLDERRPVIEVGAAARRLIGSQTVALGGRICGATESAKAHPFATSVMFIVLGETVFQTLALNLLVYDGRLPIPSTPNDVPSWELDIRDARKRAPEGYVDLATLRPRRYRLVPGDVDGRVVVGVVAAGEADRFDAEDCRDPLAGYRRSESEGLVPLRVNPDRALWRDSLPFFAGEQSQELAPANIRQAATLVQDGVIPRHQLLRLMAVGFVTERGKAAKMRMGRSEVLPVPAKLLAEPGTLPMIEQALAQATDTGNAVRSSAFIAAKHSLSTGERSPDKGDVGKLADAVGSQAVYWSRAGEAFPKLLLDLAAARPDAQTRWNAALRAAAEEGFHCVEVKLGASSRGYKAVTLGRVSLTRRLREVLPIPETQEATR